MKIKKWHSPTEQVSRIGNNEWSVPRLFALSKHLDVIDVQINHMSLNYVYKEITLRDMIMHINAINDSDLDCPIILDENGDIMDGRHRLMKAILLGRTTIKAVRFDENPTPDRVLDV